MSESTQLLPVLKLPGIDASKFTVFTYSYNTERGILNLRVRRAGGGGNIGKAGGFGFTNKALVGLDVDSMAKTLPVLIERGQREYKPLKPHVNLVKLCAESAAADATEAAPSAQSRVQTRVNPKKRKVTNHRHSEPGDDARKYKRFQLII
jgi:hypothetical protein